MEGTAKHYRGIAHALVRIGSEEGLRGLYKGLGITLLVQVLLIEGNCKVEG